MRQIEMFTDVGLSEDEINKKYPEPTFLKKIKNFINNYKILIAPLIIIIIIYLVEVISKQSANNSPHIFKQSGGNPMMAEEALSQSASSGANMESSSGSSTMRKVRSPVSSTFGMITSVLGKFLKLLMLLVMIVIIPSVPIILYCLVAYYVIKRFLFMVTSVE
jgi:hypothetical protein